jgi:hypothetical protein
VTRAELLAEMRSRVPAGALEADAELACLLALGTPGNGEPDGEAARRKAIAYWTERLGSPSITRITQAQRVARQALRLLGDPR